MLDMISLDRKAIEVVDILISNSHLPYREMKRQSDRIPPLQKCNQKGVIPIDATHKGHQPKPHFIEKNMVYYHKELPPFLEDGQVTPL